MKQAILRAVQRGIERSIDIVVPTVIAVAAIVVGIILIFTVGGGAAALGEVAYDTIKSSLGA